MISEVNFVDSIINLYNSGVRIFIESGPSNILTNIVKDILMDKDVKVICTNLRDSDADEIFKKSLAELFSYGVDITAVPSKSVLGLQYNNPKSFLNTKSDSNISFNNENIVYSGVSVGLPGTFKKAFSGFTHLKSLHYFPAIISIYYID